jgi:hypothetical protein
VALAASFTVDLKRGASSAPAAMDDDRDASERMFSGSVVRVET